MMDSNETLASTQQRSVAAGDVSPSAVGGDRRWLVVALLSLAGFVGLTIAVAMNTAFPFDRPLLSVAGSWQVSADVWKAISETANIPLIVIGIGSVLGLFLTGHRREALIVLLMLAAVTAGSEGVKQLTQRPRPEAGTASGIPGVVYSYPSGHVLEALTILGFVAIRTWRKARLLVLRVGVTVAVILEVALVAVARVALSAHYPTDVLAGFLGGFSALGFYGWLTRPGAWADRPASPALPSTAVPTASSRDR